MAVLSGCGLAKPWQKLPEQTPQVPAWQDRWQDREQVASSKELPQEVNGPLVSLALKEAPLEMVMQRLAREYGVSMVAPESLLSRSITLDLREQKPEVVMSLLARVLETEVTKEAGVWIVGGGKPTDKVVIVRRVRGLEPAKVNDVVAAIGAETSNLVMLDSGVLVLGGTPTILRRVNSVLSEIEATERPMWAVQLHLVTLSARDVSDLGMSLTPALDMAVGQAVGSAVPSANPVQLQASLRAVLRASQQRSTINVVGQPVFLVLDGGEASFKREKQFSYRMRVTNQNGVVSDSGVSQLAAGTTVKLKVREVSPSRLLVDCNLEVSELGEISQEGLPAKESREHVASMELEHGGCYLLTSFETTAARDSLGTWFRWGGTRDNSQEILQVWARAVAVSGKLKEVRGNGGTSVGDDGGNAVGSWSPARSRFGGRLGPDLGRLVDARRLRGVVPGAGLLRG